MAPRVALRTLTDPAPRPVRAPGAQRTWRVWDTDGATHGAAPALSADPDDAPASTVSRPSIGMPAAITELSEILAGDTTLCIKRTAVRPSVDGGTTKSASKGLPPPAMVLPAADASVEAVAELSNASPGKSARASPGPGRCREIDSRLARVIDAWSELPQPIRAAILGMIEATRCPG
jgi:hypothetical protein